MRSRSRDWGFEPFMWWWPPTGRRRGRRRWFGAGDMKYVILRMLSEKPMHGYEVMRELEDRTRGCYKPSPGTVYPTLQWLEDEGLVQSEESEGKRVYKITDAGREFLSENRSTVEEIFERVEEMMDHLVGDPMPEVNRLVGRLVKEVYRSTWKLRDDEEKRRRVAQVLEHAIEEVRATTESAA